MFALLYSKRKDSNTSVPNSWDGDWNNNLGVFTPLMFFYLADHLLMPGLRINGLFGRMATVEVELATLGLFLRTVRHGVVNRFSTDDMTRICNNDSARVCVSRDWSSKWFALDTFSVLRCMSCTPGFGSCGDW